MILEISFLHSETARIDGVVEDAYAKFKNLYYLNEPVNVSWDGSA